MITHSISNDPGSAETKASPDSFILLDKFEWQRSDSATDIAKDNEAEAMPLAGLMAHLVLIYRIL